MRTMSETRIVAVGFHRLKGLLQALVPWRSFDPLDALFNALGAALGALVWFTPAAGALYWVDRRLR